MYPSSHFKYSHTNGKYFTINHIATEQCNCMCGYNSQLQCSSGRQRPYLPVAAEYRQWLYKYYGCNQLYYKPGRRDSGNERLSIPGNNKWHLYTFCNFNCGYTNC